MDGQAMYSQILLGTIHTRNPSTDWSPPPFFTQIRRGEATNSMTRYKLPKTPLAYLRDIFTSTTSLEINSHAKGAPGCNLQQDAATYAGCYFRWFEANLRKSSFKTEG